MFSKGKTIFQLWLGQILWSINATMRNRLLVSTNCWTLDTTKTGKLQESLLTFRLIVTNYSLSGFSFLKWNFIQQGRALGVFWGWGEGGFFFPCYAKFPPTYALSFMKDCCLYLMHTLPILSNSKAPLQCTWKENLEHQCMGQKQIWLVITRCWEVSWQLNNVYLSRDRKVPQVPVTNILLCSTLLKYKHLDSLK